MFWGGHRAIFPGFSFAHRVQGLGRYRLLLFLVSHGLSPHGAAAAEFLRSSSRPLLLVFVSMVVQSGLAPLCRQQRMRRPYGVNPFLLCPTCFSVLQLMPHNWSSSGDNQSHRVQLESCVSRFWYLSFCAVAFRFLPLGNMVIITAVGIGGRS